MFWITFDDTILGNDVHPKSRKSDMQILAALATDLEDNLPFALVVFAIGFLATVVTFVTVWVSHARSKKEPDGLSPSTQNDESDGTHV